MSSSFIDYIKTISYSIGPKQGRAPWFIQNFINILGQNYSKAVNKQDNFETNYPHAYALMVNKEYIKKNTDALPTDVHNEFTDLIIRIGAFHGQFDKRTIESVRARNILEDLLSQVYCNWNNLVPSAKSYYVYFFDFEVKNPLEDTFRILDTINYANYPFKDLAGTVNYRITVKKDDKNIPLFCHIIPLVPVNASVYVTISSNDRPMIIALDYEMNLLKKLYTKAYIAFSNINDMEPPNTVILGKTGVRVPSNGDFNYGNCNFPSLFSIDVNDYAKRKLYNSTNSISSYIATDKTVGTLPNLWMVDENGNFYMLLEDGTKELFGLNQKADEDLIKEDNNCFSTFGSSNDKNNCRTYFFDCLLDNDTDFLSDKCTKLWTSPDFYDMAIEEVSNLKKLHPSVVWQTLAKYGFRVVTNVNPATYKQIYEIETVNSWIENVVKELWTNNKIDGVSLSDIVNKNKNLLSYLDMLVRLVNSNPDLLNAKPKQPSKELSDIGIGIEKKGGKNRNNNQLEEIDLENVYSSIQIMIKHIILKMEDLDLDIKYKNIVAKLIIDTMNHLTELKRLYSLMNTHNSIAYSLPSNKSIINDDTGREIVDAINKRDNLLSRQQHKFHNLLANPKSPFYNMRKRRNSHKDKTGIYSSFTSLNSVKPKQFR